MSVVDGYPRHVGIFGRQLLSLLSHLSQQTVALFRSAAAVDLFPAHCSLFSTLLAQIIPTPDDCSHASDERDGFGVVFLVIEVEGACVYEVSPALAGPVHAVEFPVSAVLDAGGYAIGEKSEVCDLPHALALKCSTYALRALARFSLRYLLLYGHREE